MFSAYDMTFSLLDWLALTGLAQALMIMVYIVARVRHWQLAALPLLYFLTLALSFGLQFSLRLDDYETQIRLGLWLCWCLSPALCHLLVLQVGANAAGSRWRIALALIGLPLALAMIMAVDTQGRLCVAGQLDDCGHLFAWLNWAGAMWGACWLLSLWLHRTLFSGLRQQKGGRERYWLILTLVVANIGIVIVRLLRSSDAVARGEGDALQVTLGIAFLYLATTTLFRVYPASMQLAETPRFRTADMSAEDGVLLEKIREYLDVQKVYHEQTFSRADLARELNVSENTLSRVVNQGFQKSFPRLLNEYRVADAKRMLETATIPIQVVASEVGFNSLASFNRVFKELTGETPSAYRQGVTNASKEAKP